MTSMTQAEAADLKMLDQVESGVVSTAKVPISPRDFALSVSSNLSAKRKLWANLQQFKNSDDQVFTIVRSAATTVLSRENLWMTVSRLVLVYVCVAVLTVMACPYPTAHSVDTLHNMSGLLRVIVALVLSFLIFCSMNRWHKCSSGFLVLFDAIQKLQMQFIAFGCADEAHAMLATRYGLLSAHLLSMKLHCEARGDEAQKEAFAEMWAKVTATKEGVTKCDFTQCVVLRDEELESLQEVDDFSGMMWVWVVSLIGRMAQDGSIPDMQSSTFGHIVNLAEVARGGIRQVHSCSGAQTPDIYLRILAVVLHVSNLMSAVSFGLLLGARNAVFLVEKGARAGGDGAERDLQMFLLSFFFCVCGPVLYQAFLEVSVLVALPYASKYEESPAKEMISRLEMSLAEASMVSRQWQQPSFKVPSVP